MDAIEHLEEFYELIYERFPWVEDIIEGSDYECWPLEEIHKNFESFLELIINKAVEQGSEDAKQSLGEYIDHLKTKLAIAEQKLVSVMFNDS